MNIEVAKGSGFCFGVRRAYKILEEEIDRRAEGDRIFTLGSFVHNPLITEQLRDRGVYIIDESDIPRLAEEASENAAVTIILRTHGVSKGLYGLLKKYSESNPYFRYVDCTCPCVSKIHRIAENESAADPENTLIVIIGDEDHPEVKAIESYCGCDYTVCSDPEDISKIKTDKSHIVCVTQTTEKQTNCKLCQNLLIKSFTKSKIYDTICKVTEERQTEVEKLARRSDVMLVMGGRESSNTNKLFEISQTIQPKTFFVERISELPLDCIGPDIKLGITAGASTPDSLIEEAIKAMSENLEKNTEDFGAMLNESEIHTVKTGQLVKGVILGLDDREIRVDLGSNLTGIISASEVSDDSSLKITDAFKIGDEIEAIVIKTNDQEGTANLSKRQADNRANKSRIAEAFENGTILEGKVTEIAKNKEGVAKGLIFAALSTKFFIPASQTGIPKGEDISKLLGTTQRVKITELGAPGKRAVASISVVLKEERNAEIEAFWNTLQVGQVFEGTVKSITDYGVFVNIGPVDGMVHKSELSWQRFRIPADIVSVGDKLTVYVKSLNPEKKRISLGCKTEENNPWNIFTNKYSEGDVVPVKIASLMTYGAFAEIIPGVDGLIHISQISEKRIGNPAEVLHVGDTVNVKITAIDYENKKVSLSIREAGDEPVYKENTEAAETEEYANDDNAESSEVSEPENEESAPVSETAATEDQQ